MKQFTFADITGNLQQGRPKKRVVVRGPVATQSGYAVHARQLVRWLLQKHDAEEIELRLQPTRWGDTPWLLDRAAVVGSLPVGRLLDMCTDDQSRADVSFQVQLPNEWDPKLALVNIGVTAGVETDRCNPAWVSAVNAMSAVIVPSQHVARCFAASGRVTAPVSVVAEAYPDCLESTDVVPLDLGPLPEFCFLVVGQFTSGSPKADRKRLQETLEWLCAEFAGDPTVGIIVKTNMGKGSRIDRAMCERTLRECCKRQDASPKVTLVHGALTDEEMHALYRHPSVKALVTCTRGEGFGLPILEAAAAGIPVVATNWSGHLDFLSAGKFIRLDYSLREIPKDRADANIFVPGSRWAEVDAIDFKKKVRKLRDSYQVPKEWAVELASRLRQTNSFEAVAASYERAVGEHVR